MKTLSATPRPLYHWKAEDLSFLYVLLVWGVKLVSSKGYYAQNVDISLEANGCQLLATGP